MPLFDLPLAELERRRLDQPEPPDLDDFWRRALDAARAAAGEPTFTPYRPDVYRDLLVEDVRFGGADGHEVRAWLLRPRAASGPLPCVVRFIGYGGGRGVPLEHAALPAVGLATLVMDTRGQGGQWTVGATGDPAGAPGPEHPGVLTRGLLDPETYYYRRLYVDSARAVETAATHPALDPTRIAVAGHSQGGGLSLAAAALVPDAVVACYPDMPFLCDFRRGAEVASEHPYLELTQWLSLHTGAVEQAFRTLAYHDCVHLARRIRVRCVLSVGLMDAICPPSTVYAAYNALEAPKQMIVLPFGGHEVPRTIEEQRLADQVATLAG